MIIWLSRPCVRLFITIKSAFFSAAKRWIDSDGTPLTITVSGGVSRFESYSEYFSMNSDSNLSMRVLMSLMVSLRIASLTSSVM